MEREEREKVEGEVRFVREVEAGALVGALVPRLLLARWCRRWLWLLFDVDARETDDR